MSGCTYGPCARTATLRLTIPPHPRSANLCDVCLPDAIRAGMLFDDPLTIVVESIPADDDG